MRSTRWSVAGLGLHCLQRHAGLAEAGQAGVAQLVASRLGQSRAFPRAVKDLVQPSRGQRLAASWTLQHDEQHVCAGVGGSFTVQIGRNGGKEPA